MATVGEQQELVEKTNGTSAAARPAIAVPYINAYGNITKALERIQTASTPDRFTHDFLATKLNIKGGSGQPVIPFLKKVGFLNGDGSPTDLYKQFRNATMRGSAAAQAVKKGFAPLYEVNEYVHDVSDRELTGIIVQVTGLESQSTTAKAILGSFKALRAFADFDAAIVQDVEEPEVNVFERTGQQPAVGGQKVGLKLGYTINLNLPATSDVAVFDAIFKSLREHLLD